MFRTLIAIGIILIGAASAGATSLHTPAVFVQDDDKFHCILSNVASKKPIDVTLTIYKADGTVRSTTTKTVGMGESGLLAILVSASDDLRCSFEFKGSKKKVRAALRFFEDGLSDSLVVLEAY